MADSSVEREMSELTARLTQVPSFATVKGMFITAFLESLDRAGHPRPTRERFLSFRDYPVTRFMGLMLDAVQSAWPGESPRESLRKLGQQAYPTFASSMAGRVLFAIAGSDFHAALPLTRRAYELSLSQAKVNLRNLEPGSAVVELRDVWNFADCYQVGVFEGALIAFGAKGVVRCQRLRRPWDVDLYLEWA